MLFLQHFSAKKTVFLSVEACRMGETIELKAILDNLF
jgi:hypothetical protein